MFDLRPAVADDADDVSRIYIDSWNDGFGHLLGHRAHEPDRTERWRTDLVADDVAWTVVTDDRALVGFVGVGPSRDPIDSQLGELQTIAVDTEHWRRGVGRLLMSAALSQLSARWRRAILWTPANYDRGHDFYRAMGWQSTGADRYDSTEVSFDIDLVHWHS